MPRARDITGQRFGRLVALYPTEERRHNGQIVWCLRCDDGNEIKSVIGPLGTRIKSCGCLRRENRHRHGESPRGNTSSLYQCWRNIKERWLNHQDPGFKNYGGRGITMWPEWINNYPAFRDHVLYSIGPGPSPKYSIDRINNNGNYEPGNLKWSTRSQQMLNARSATELTKYLNELVRNETL
jgi:hypothetical protein